MNARFRVRLRDGGDLTVETLDGLLARVADGTIDGQDLIHDALTGEWAPANSLPVFWLCSDLLANGSSPGSDPSAVSAAEELRPQGQGVLTEEAGFELVVPSPTSPDQEAAAFIARMEKERIEEAEAPPALAELVTLEAPEEASASPPASAASPASSSQPAMERERREPVRTPESTMEPTRSRTDEGAGEAPFPSEVPSLSRSASWRPRRHRIRRHHQVSMAVALVLGSAGLAGGVGLAWPGLAEPQATEDPAAALAVARPVPATDEEIRSGAYADFLETLAALGAEMGIGAPPEIWLEGRYLAAADAFPEVAAYWQAYADYLARARAEDGELYRNAYLDRVQAAGLSGPVRSLRLATAMADFDAARGERTAAYARVGELVEAALALHGLSAQSRGRISYEPARSGNRVSADPVIEAAGRDEEMQVALDSALDRVLVALHGEVEGEGPGREGLAGWLVRELEKGGY